MKTPIDANITVKTLKQNFMSMRLHWMRIAIE